MIYIYDILLNFCDSDMIYDFYEWNKEDSIDNVKRIKLLHVDRKCFDDLVNYDCIIDENILLKIYRTCEIYEGKRIKILDYCCLFSDGDRVLAIEFDKEGHSVYKSKLLIDEEDEIALLASNLELSNINYLKGDQKCSLRFFTRNEIIIRNYLLKEIEESYRNKNYCKLKYMYKEYFDDDCFSYVDMKDNLLNSMKSIIDDKHSNLYKLLKMVKKKNQV